MTFKTYKTPRQMPKWIQDECFRLTLPNGNLRYVFKEWLEANHNVPCLSKGYFICYFIEGHVFGWLWLYRVKYKNRFCVQLFVDPRCRRMKIGTQLISFAQKKVEKHRNTNKKLKVIRHNRRSIHFFNNIGL